MEILFRQTKSIKLFRRFLPALSITLVLFAAALVSPHAAQAKDGTNADFVSRVWVEGDSELASVSLNGRDLITFKAKAGSCQAADAAEDMVIRLSEASTDKAFDASQIMPGRDGDKASIKIGAQQIASFAAQDLKDPNQATAFDASVKLVNDIRVELGSSPLSSAITTMASATPAIDAGQMFSGQASWYGPHFHGHRTSDGHRYDQEKLTAAHRSLPFGTKLLVVNRRTGATCVVEVNDRGPYFGDRVIDLSHGAAKQLNMLGSGVAMVDCMVIGSNNQ